MKKLLLTTFLLLTASAAINVFAGNWTIGLSPIGTQNLVLNFKDPSDKFFYDYRTTVGFSLSVESLFEDGIIEISHFRGTLTDSRHEGDKLYMKNEPGSIRATSLMRYWGKVFNDGNRIQFPVYAGAGFGKIKAADINTLSLELGAKAGAKFYITNTVGAFSNAGFRADFGREHYNSESYEDLRPSVTRFDFYVELGVALDF